jgi:hypothetical protein
LSLLQGNLPMALPHLELAMGICQDTDIPFYVPMVAPAMGAACALQKQHGYERELGSPGVLESPVHT